MNTSKPLYHDRTSFPSLSKQRWYTPVVTEFALVSADDSGLRVIRLVDGVQLHKVTERVENLLQSRGSRFSRTVAFSLPHLQETTSLSYTLYHDDLVITEPICVEFRV